MDLDVIFTTEYAVEAYGKYYFVASEMNLLCAFETQNNKIEIIGCIPEENIFKKRSFIKLLTWEGELIAIPMNGRGIWFFHIAEKRWHKICIKSENVWRKIRQAFIYHGCLFMIGCHYPAIICMDLKTEEIRYFDAPFKAVQRFYRSLDGGFGYFRHDCVIRGNLLYFACFITNKVLIFNLDNFQWDYMTVGNAKDGYSGIAWDGRFFWLAPRNECFIVRWDGKFSYEEFMIHSQVKNRQPMYTGVVAWNNNIIFPAVGAKYTVTLNHGNISDYVLEEKNYIFYSVSYDGKVVFSERNGDITVVSVEGEKYCINCRISLEKLLEELKITKDEYSRLLKNKFNSIVYEDKFIHLQTLLLFLGCRSNAESIKPYDNKETYGKTIWHNMK